MDHIQLLVFDWDGTLIDSVGRIVACFERSFAAFKLPWPGDEPVKATIGLPLTASYHLLLPEESSITQEEWIESYRQIWRSEAFQTPSPLFPGVPDLLRRLSRRYQLCIATGKSREGLERELAYYELAEFFRVTRCANETQPKPHPEMLEQLLCAHDVQGSEAIMIGDSALDIEMGNRAGLATIAVTSGGQSEEILRAARPSEILDHVTQLESVLR